MFEWHWKTPGSSGSTLNGRMSELELKIGLYEQAPTFGSFQGIVRIKNLAKMGVIDSDLKTPSLSVLFL